MKRTAVFCIALASLCMGSRARAELTWAAPAGCPSSQMVNARIKSLVANDEALASFHGEATVVFHPELPSPWQALIRTMPSSHEGERLFEGASCTAVADATAVFVALMLSPPSAEQKQGPHAAPPKRSRPTPPIQAQVAEQAAPPPPQEEASPAAMPPAVVQTSVARVDAAPAVQPIALGFRVRLMAGASVATLPNTTADVGFAIGADFLERFSFLAFELGARAHKSTNIAPPVAAAPYANITSGALDAHTSLCLRTPSRQLFARGCALAALQRLEAASEGVAVRGDKAVLLPMGGASAVLGWTWRRGFSAIAEARADYRFVTPRFTLPPWGTVWAPAPVTFGMSLGIEWRP